MERLVHARGLEKRYGDVTALGGVDLDVHAGEIVGLLGPNGAGKTTLLNIVIGLRRPSAGTVELFGGDPQEPASRVALGTTPQETGLPPTLRVGECVDFVRAHHPAPMDRDAVLDRFGLDGLAKRQTGGLSGGQRRRLAVALAFAPNPRLVVLDEPTTGLDVDARRALWEAIRDYHRDGGTVVVTSHHLEEIEALAERVVVLGGGRVLVDDDLAVVRDVAGVRRLRVTAPSLPELPGVVSQEGDGDHHDLVVADADEAVRVLVGSGVEFSDLEVVRATLEESFLALTATDRTTA